MMVNYEKVYKLLVLFFVNSVNPAVNLFLLTIIQTKISSDDFAQFILYTTVLTVVISAQSDTMQNLIISKGGSLNRIDKSYVPVKSAMIIILGIFLVLFILLQYLKLSFFIPKSIYYVIFIYGGMASIYHGWLIGVLRICDKSLLAGVLTKVPQTILLTLLVIITVSDNFYIYVTALPLVAILSHFLYAFSSERGFIKQLLSKNKWAYLQLIINTFLVILYSQISLIIAYWDPFIDIQNLKFAMQFATFVLMPVTTMYFMFVPSLVKDFDKLKGASRRFALLILFSTVVYAAAGIFIYFFIELYFNYVTNNVDITAVQTYFIILYSIFFIQVLFGPSNYILSLLGYASSANTITLITFSVFFGSYLTLNALYIKEALFISLFMGQVYWRVHSFITLRRFIL